MSEQYRTEKDAMGEIQVAESAYWGAQTQRSLENFKIGTEKMPLPLIRALGYQKKAAASANLKLGLLDKQIADPMITAATEIIDGKMDAHFPLVVWHSH